jgi:hypothetical protein
MQSILKQPRKRSFATAIALFPGKRSFARAIGLLQTIRGLSPQISLANPSWKDLN